MVFLVAAREEGEHGHVLRVERRGVGGQIRVFLQGEVEPGGDVAFLDELTPRRRRADTLEVQLIVAQAAHHVEVHVSDDVRERERRALGEVRGANQASRGEKNAAPESNFFQACLLGNCPGQFQQGRGATCVVVRAGVNFAFLILAREAASLAVAEVIVVRADDDILARADGREVREDVAVLLLDVLDGRCGPAS